MITFRLCEKVWSWSPLLEAASLPDSPQMLDLNLHNMPALATAAWLAANIMQTHTFLILRCLHSQQARLQIYQKYLMSLKIFVVARML